jgi:fermentation-respiration switch protein FrsA (DUF1100 family)
MIKNHIKVLLMLFTSNMLFAGISDWFAFFPDKDVIYEIDEEYIRELYINCTKNVKIHAYYLYSTTNKKVLIYFHGNAGNNSHRIDHAKILYNMGVNVLLISYQGYGKSSGNASEKNLYNDAQCAYAFAVENLGYDADCIYLYGRSIGSTAAVDVASRNKTAGVVLVTPLYSGKKTAQSMGMGFFSNLAGNSFHNASKINRITVPVLFIHGTKDEVVPFEHGKMLYEEYKGAKTLVVIEGGSHNDLDDVDSQLFWNSIDQFLKSDQKE